VQSSPSFEARLKARQAIEAARVRAARPRVLRNEEEELFPLARLRDLHAAAARASAPNSRGELAPLTPSALFTLSAIAAYTNRDGDTYVSVRAVARELHRPEGSISRDVVALVAAGLIERRRGPRSGDQRRATLHLPLMVRR